VSSPTYREIPSVDDLLRAHEGRLPRPLLVAVVREALEDARDAIAAGAAPDVEGIVTARVESVSRSRTGRVVNATGVLLHTNLGRSSWSARALDRAHTAAAHPTAVELDLATGERSLRGAYVGQLLRVLTGCGDSLVVNNNAAAVTLALAATSSGLGVPVSRGEMIEIGGSYRMPEVVAASGALLVEVGTTNRTRPGDYRTALQTHRCGAVLKVHPSNFEVTGFTEEAALEDLAVLAGAQKIPLIHDIGSGLLDTGAAWLPEPAPSWLAGEPGARQSLAAGADLVCFSGDKLLGGPQAGVIVGSAEAVARLRRHPLARALRVDGVTLAALEATLEACAEGSLEEIPFWRQALAPLGQIETRAASMAGALGGRVGEGASAVGAGSAPTSAVPTRVVVLPGEDHLHGPLLAGPVPVLTRRLEGGLVMDPRTIDPEDDPLVVDAVLRCR
jgi:L-seryl-tRNA(Ser) seleniumtransferase